MATVSIVERDGGASGSSSPIDRLRAGRTFFAHQSVGENVVTGVAELLSVQSGPSFAVTDVTGSGVGEWTGLQHGRVGRNTEPETKVADFVAAVVSASPGPLTALLKFCYVDCTATTDPDALFALYRASVAELKVVRPDLRIVHVTIPLTADRGVVRHWAAVLRGLTSAREANARRAQYNALLRRTYAGEPIFDLARLESTDAAGRSVAVRYRGQDVPVLSREWTNDGGHLNEAGRRRAAESFLATVASAQA